MNGLRDKAKAAALAHRMDDARVVDEVIRSTHPREVEAVTKRLREITDPYAEIRFRQAHVKGNHVEMLVVLLVGAEAYKVCARTYGETAHTALWLLPADDNFPHPSAQSFRGRSFSDLVSLGDAIANLERNCQPVTIKSNGSDFWKDST